MDSKVVNKLIRSEVWALLRREGFSKFSGRSAWRYRTPLVDVVNFQSFNSYLAEGIGCTTYSFAVNIGVYLRGAEWEDRIKVDSKGRFMPLEYHCPFRLQLEKRSPIDLFERPDIFFIDADGLTAAAVFGEVRYLLEKRAMPWYDALGDLDAILAWMADENEISGLPDGLGPGHLANRGSYSWTADLANLRLIKHSERPTKDSALLALGAINDLIGSVQDIFIPSLNPPSYVEMQTNWLAALMHRLEGWLPANQRHHSGGRREDRPFAQSRYESGLEKGDHREPAAAVSPRKAIWPMLRRNGFSEFTDRLAHRHRGDSVEVVSFLPLKLDETKRQNLPPDLFRLGVGVFWPLLAELDSFRRNRRGEPRPSLEECHLQMWLVSDFPVDSRIPTAFSSASESMRALETGGLSLLSFSQSARELEVLLDCQDWELFKAYPMLRGIGSAPRAQRALLRAVLAHVRGNAEDAQRHIEAGIAAVGEYPEHLQTRYLRWLERVASRVIRG